jgi:hypothetical protein
MEPVLCSAAFYCASPLAIFTAAQVVESKALLHIILITVLIIPFHRYASISAIIKILFVIRFRQQLLILRSPSLVRFAAFFSSYLLTVVLLLHCLPSLPSFQFSLHCHSPWGFSYWLQSSPCTTTSVFTLYRVLIQL